MDHPMMKCGHAANAFNGEGEPSCVICVGINPGAEEIMETPNLQGRRAHCSYYSTCRSEEDSSPNLPFFEYRGPGSHWAVDICHCGFVLRPDHGYYTSGRRNPAACVWNGKQPSPRGPSEFDSYYCGCNGWD